MYLSQNNFDIVAVQEDFNYHQNLVDNFHGFNYQTKHTGSIPGGDGLNVFTKNMTIYNETRVEWNDACGILTDGSDELTPKGFVYSVINIGNGIYLDFYNLHADAYGGEGSVAARTNQYRQLADFIKARSAENDRPIIITGDFNNHFHYKEDNHAMYNIFCRELGFKDAWVENYNDGDYFDFLDWQWSGVNAWGNWDCVERFMYKAGGGVDIAVNELNYVEVFDDSGNVVSDHSSGECDFLFIKTSDFIENSGELKVTEAPANNFLTRLMWIFKVLVMIFSDIENLPSIIEELI